MSDTETYSKKFNYDKGSKRLTIDLYDFTYIAHYNKSIKISKVLNEFRNSIERIQLKEDDIAILDLQDLKPVDKSKSLKNLDLNKSPGYIIGLRFHARFVDKDGFHTFSTFYPYNIQVKRIIEEINSQFNSMKGEECNFFTKDKYHLPYYELLDEKPENNLENFIKNYGNYVKIILQYKIPNEIQEHIDIAMFYIKKNRFDKALKEYQNASELAQKDDFIEVIKKVSKLMSHCKKLNEQYKTTPPNELFPPGAKRSPFLKIRDKMLNVQEKLLAGRAIDKDNLHPPKPSEVFTEQIDGENIEDIISPASSVESEEEKSKVHRKKEQVKYELLGGLKRGFAESTKKVSTPSFAQGGSSLRPSKVPLGPPSLAPGSAPPAGGIAPPPGTVGRPKSPGGLRGAITSELRSLFQRRRAGGSPDVPSSTSYTPQLITYDINLGMQYYSVMMERQSYLFYVYFSHKELKIEDEEGKVIYETTFTITTTKEEPPQFKVKIEGEGFKVDPLSGKVVVDKEQDGPSMMIFSIKPKKLKKKKLKEKDNEERRNLNIYVEFEKKIVSHTIISVIVQSKHFSLDLGPIHLNLSKHAAMSISFIPVLITAISAIYTILTFDPSSTSEPSFAIGMLSGFIPGIGSMIFFAAFLIALLKKGIFPIKQKWSNFINFDNTSSMMK